jgi:hypothetical protein
MKKERINKLFFEKRPSIPSKAQVVVKMPGFFWVDNK